MLSAEIKNLSLKKIDNRTLLSDISFTLNNGNLYSVLGENGSGKSTLLKALTGLLDKRFYNIDGKILIDGTDILSANENVLLELRRNKIKYVMQDAMNSFDHLKRMEYYFKRIVKDSSEINELLEYFKLPEQTKLFKLYAYELSGGMAQRVSFVLALLSHPKIILLDEPTSGIDSASANLFLLKLKEYTAQKNNLVLLVTHDLQFAEKSSDKIALLSNGTLSDFIPVQEFFNSEIYKTAYA